MPVDSGETVDIHHGGTQTGAPALHVACIDVDKEGFHHLVERSPPPLLGQAVPCQQDLFQVRWKPFQHL